MQDEKERLLVKCLFDLETEEDVEDLFEQNGITSLVEKTKYLDEAQGTTKTYSTPSMDDKDKYEMSLEAFLDPFWRNLNEQQGISI